MLSIPPLGRMCWGFIFVWSGLLNLYPASESVAQSELRPESPSTALAPEVTRVDASTLEELANAVKAPQPTPDATAPAMDFMSLLIKGGIFMIPIAIVSLIVVMFIFERVIGLRSGKLIPRALVRKLRQLSLESASIDPRIAYEYCSEYPSAASNVIRAILLRAGRPHPEIAAAAADVSQREADKAFGGVRWLYFCAGVAPLLGLLGTVWGLIRAFHDLTLLGPLQSRAEFLGRGIYEALVTTLAGLVIAIPAAIAAHFFEGRILRIFRSIEELTFSLIPKLEVYEGRVRFDPVGSDLVARTLEPGKKPAAVSLDATKAATSPPVQSLSTPAVSTHAASAAPVRKSIYNNP